jgi:hypothetical protein
MVGTDAWVSSVLGVTILLFAANAAVILFNGWTECDRGDCGRWYPYFSMASKVLGWLIVGCIVIGFAVVVLEARREMRRTDSIARRRRR